MRHTSDTEVKFRRMFEAHYDLMLRYCLRRLPPSDANDAVAEVFAVVWRRIDSVPAGDDAVLWIYGVARNIVRNAKRASRRSVRLRAKLDSLAAESVPDTATVVVANEEDRQLVEALTRLSADDQEIIRLRAYEGLTSNQIAVVVGCSHDAARKRLSCALSRLARGSSRSVSRAGNRSRETRKGGDL